MAIISADPVKSPGVFIRLAREQNSKNNQHSDGTDINKYLHQPDELRAKEKEKRGDANKRGDETKRRMDKLRQ